MEKFVGRGREKGIAVLLEVHPFDLPHATLPSQQLQKVQKTGLALKPASIYHLVKRAGKRVGLKLTPSDLRDKISSTVEKYKVPFSVIEQMMGHLAYYSTSAGSYKRFSVDELREFYQTVESLLTIETIRPTKEKNICGYKKSTSATM